MHINLKISIERTSVEWMSMMPFVQLFTFWLISGIRLRSEHYNMAKSSNSSDFQRIVHFNISGAIGTALFYALYEIVLSRLGLVLDPNYSFLVQNKLTVAWTASYLASIIWQ